MRISTIRPLLLTVLALLLWSGAAAAQTLTSAQLTTLKNDIAANTNTPSDGSVYASTPINQIPNNDDGNTAIAGWYSKVASPTFYVYRTNVPIDDIRDQINWSNMTPADAPDGTQTWLNRATAAQGKQFNLQLLLTSSTGTINAAKPNIRAGLTDALTNFPTGTGGALLSGGWGTVRDNALARAALRIEKLFATGSGATAATAATMAVEGAINLGVVSAARNN